MKPKNSAITILIIGLLLTTTFPMVSRRLQLPDFFTGFITGIGIVLELFAVVKIISQRKSMSHKG